MRKPYRRDPIQISVRDARRIIRRLWDHGTFSKLLLWLIILTAISERKEYVSDGIVGRHSPFAKQFIDALEKGMGSDGILTLSELMTYVETLKTAPQFGKFGADQLGSDFVFVVKGN